jgi:hypothetical protein
MKITYDDIVEFLRNQKKFSFSVKKNYMVINVPRTNYHITVFQDQWDDYYKETKLPYHLFHISSEDKNNRCSSYFWVNFQNKVVSIPPKYFRYNQPNYSFFSSTRFPCNIREIKHHLKVFSKILMLTSFYKKNQLI